jgi:putative endonuclease
MRDAVGRAGEDAALARYRSLGYRLVARNWRCDLGEIDLILARDDLLVVCEVKARRGTTFGGPHDAVTATKQRKLRLLAEAFLRTLRPRPSEVRFDVASVSLTGERSHVHLFQDAF